MVEGKARLEYPIGKVLVESQWAPFNIRVSPDGKQVRTFIERPYERPMVHVVPAGAGPTVCDVDGDGENEVVAVLAAPDGSPYGAILTAAAAMSTIEGVTITKSSVSDLSTPLDLNNNPRMGISPMPGILLNCAVVRWTKPLGLSSSLGRSTKNRCANSLKRARLSITGSFR